MIKEDVATISYAGKLFKIYYHIHRDYYLVYFQRTWIEERKLVAKLDSMKECLQYIESKL